MATEPNADILKRAVQKVVASQSDTLTLDERAALKSHEKTKEEKLRWQYYESIPAKHWKAMSGRQTKVINEQAVRYNIPFGGAVINLPKVIKALHDFLAENKHKLARDDDDLMSGPNSPALERYREERAAIAKLNRLERERELLPRDLVRQSMSRSAACIRQVGESLQKQFGDAAALLLYEGIDDALAEIGRFFAGNMKDAPDAAD